MLNERDKTKRYITVLSAPDKEGKQRFVMDWWTAWNPSTGTSGWRGQYFYAALTEHRRATDVMVTGDIV